MDLLPNIIFVLLLIIGIGFFSRNIKRIIRNVKLGKEIDLNDNKPQRFKNMARIALGQSKMVVRPIAGFLHILVYLGFIIINIEILEIIIDGIFGTHRIFAPLGGLYDFLIGSFEILALLVIVAVIVFWLRRNILRLARFIKPEMRGWPKKDADLILYIELVLMILFLTMNGADYQLQLQDVEPYVRAGSYPVSQYLGGILGDLSVSSLILVERSAWWLHIVGILFFLNYLYYSKHLHIILAFPNTYFGSLNPQGQFDNLEAVTKEVKLAVIIARGGS